MAHSLIRALDFPLLTADHKKRAIRRFLFDDCTWSIRYALVEVGTWHASRLVAVPTQALNLPDWNEGVVQTAITLEELARHPDADTVRPVCRQQQLAWKKHYGWDDEEHFGWGPSLAALPRTDLHLKANGDDPHLRSTEHLLSYQVWRDNGYVGLLKDYLVDDHGWAIEYLLVKVGDWTYYEQLIPCSDVSAISWGERRVVLHRVAQVS